MRATTTRPSRRSRSRSRGRGVVALAAALALVALLALLGTAAAARLRGARGTDLSPADTAGVVHETVQRYEHEGTRLDNRNRVSRGDRPPTGSAVVDPEEDEEDDDDRKRPFVFEPADVTATVLGAVATVWERRVVAWDAAGGFYGTPEGEAVANWANHRGRGRKRGRVTFEFSAGVPLQGAAVYLKGDERDLYGSSWSVQYRRTCGGGARQRLGDRWRDALQSTGELKRGWNRFKWRAPGRHNRCWRWVMIEPGVSADFTEFRWYPRLPTAEDVVRRVARRLASCEPRGWQRLPVEFPWSAVAGAEPEFRVDCDLVVRLRGLVSFEHRELKGLSSAAPPPVAVLPADARPSQWSSFVAATGRGRAGSKGAGTDLDVVRAAGWVGVVYVQTDGKVLPQTFDTEYLSLDSVVFSSSAAEEDWFRLDVTDPYGEYYGTRVSYRADSNGVVYARGAASLAESDVAALKEDDRDPMKDRPSVAVLPPPSRPTRDVLLPVATAHVEAGGGPRLEELQSRFDGAVNPALAGVLLATAAGGRLEPRVFAADYTSLDGVFWTSRVLERAWVRAKVLPPWAAAGEVSARRDDDGNVYLRGRVSASQESARQAVRYSEEPTACLRLAPGWRPPRVVVLPVATGPGGRRPPALFDGVLDSALAGVVYVMPDGRVVPSMFDVGYVSLDNVRFATKAK